MTDTDRPVITLALEATVPSGRHVWNLYTDPGTLIGWTHELPNDLVFAPGCWSYQTGGHLQVTYAPTFRKLALNQQ